MTLTICSISVTWTNTKENKNQATLLNNFILQTENVCESLNTYLMEFRLCRVLQGGNL